MRLLLPLTISALSVSALAQTTVYSNAAPRATSTVIAGSDIGAPATRYYASTATDGTNMYVFGGRGVNAAGTAIATFYNGLYAYDPVANTWTTLSAEGNPAAPVNRLRAGFAYDPTLNRLVVFGGSEGSGGTNPAMSDCFAFDLGTNTWSTIANPTPGTTGPLGSGDVKMAYDAATASIILFGGQGAGGTTNRYGDTWLLAGLSWVQLTPTNSPSARATHTMTSRSAPYNDILLVGGRDATNSRESDTWRWDGAAINWELITPVNGTTPVTFGGGNDAVYDSVRQVVTIISGPGNNVAPSSTTAAGGWTSEYDCVTNEWRAYGNSTISQTADDPIYGNVQRMPVAFLNGKTYYWGGQNPPTIGDANLAFVKEYQASPLASTIAIGAGCTGLSGNALTLSANSAPWSGRTWSATCTGMNGPSIAGTIWGFSSALNTPLFGSLNAPSTCFLHVATDLVNADLATGPSFDVTLPLPIDPALGGVELHLQVGELDLMVDNLRTSNALTLTIGSL